MKEEDGQLYDVNCENRMLFQEQFRRLVLKDEIKWKQRSRNK